MCTPTHSENKRSNPDYAETYEIDPRIHSNSGTTTNQTSPNDHSMNQPKKADYILSQLERETIL